MIFVKLNLRVEVWIAFILVALYILSISRLATSRTGVAWTWMGVQHDLDHEDHPTSPDRDYVVDSATKTRTGEFGTSVEQSHPDHHYRHDEHEYEGITERYDKWTTNATHNETGSRVLQVVTHRETILGCTSFEIFLSPKFHTLIVLPRDVALHLKLDELVRTADAEQTAGVHLFLVDDPWAGECLSRRISVDFVRRELEPRGWEIEFVTSADCDVHPFPKGHVHYVSMENSTLRMERDFRLAKHARMRGGNLETNYARAALRMPQNTLQHLPMKKQKMKIFVMNTILFEEIPDLHTMKYFHAYDIYGWWKLKLKKPPNLVKRGLPWLWDISDFMENHFLMYDFELLAGVRDDYLNACPRSFPGEPTYIGRFAHMHNMTTIRNNDIYFHLKYGHHLSEVRFPPTIDVDWIRARHFQILGRNRAPEAQQRLHETVANSSGIHPEKTDHPFVIFLCKHFRKDIWLPGEMIGSTLRNGLTRTTISGMMDYFGYRERGRDDHPSSDDEVTDPQSKSVHYELVGSFPGSRTMRTFYDGHPDYDEGKWVRLFSFRWPGSDRVMHVCFCGYREKGILSSSLSMLYPNRLCLDEDRARLYPFEWRRLEVPVGGIIEDVSVDRCNEWGFHSLKSNP